VEAQYEQASKEEDALLLAGFLFTFLMGPEDEDRTFLRNAGEFLPDCMASNSRS
jgi:hypothetical protein